MSLSRNTFDSFHILLGNIVVALALGADRGVAAVFVVAVKSRGKGISKHSVLGCRREQGGCGLSCGIVKKYISIAMIPPKQPR